MTTPTFSDARCALPRDPVREMYYGAERVTLNGADAVIVGWGTKHPTVAALDGGAQADYSRAAIALVLTALGGAFTT